MDNAPEVPGPPLLLRGDQQPCLSAATFAAGSCPVCLQGAVPASLPTPAAAPLRGQPLLLSSGHRDAVLCLRRAPVFDSKLHGHWNVPDLIFGLF